MREITRQDFEPDNSPPASLEELVREQYYGFTEKYTDKQGVEHVYPPKLPDIDELLRQVYKKIEMESLRLFHSNETWALRSYCMQTILRDIVESDENMVKMADQLMKPVSKWQNQGYDPIQKFKEKLIADGKGSHSIAQYMVAASKFVSRKGRERTYSNDDIIEHIAWLRETGYTKKRTNRKTGKVTYTKAKYTKANMRKELIYLQQFFRFLNDRGDWKLPVSLPKAPTKRDLHQPTLTKQQIEDLIFNAAIEYLPPRWIQRLAISTIYGARISELSDFELHLDGVDGSYIEIKTRKGGEFRRQPLPPQLIPLFEIPTKPMSEEMLYYAFRKMCDKLNLDLPERSGWHSIRRGVITTVYNETNSKDLVIAKFFRWQMGFGASIGQLPTYVQTPAEVSDWDILQQHPFLETWSIVLPTLLAIHPQYQGTNHKLNTQILDYI